MISDRNNNKDGNGLYVSQIEFEREREEIRKFLQEAKLSLVMLERSNLKLETSMKFNTKTLEKLESQIENVHQKVNKINETELPAIKHHNIELSTKQKVLIGVVVTVISTAINLFEMLAQSFFN